MDLLLPLVLTFSSPHDEDIAIFHEDIEPLEKIVSWAQWKHENGIREDHHLIEEFILCNILLDDHQHRRN